MTSQMSSPSVLISWAHRNTEWTAGQVKAWETTVKSFAERLRANRVNAQLDLYYQSDSSVDWTRRGQQMVRDSDFVIIAASTAWKQRWEGTNAPTEGAGAVVEADTLKGLFNANQAEFQRKTLIVLLPGVSKDTLPEDLHRLNRFQVRELTDAGINDVLRMLYQRPRHAIPDLGPMPDLPPETLGCAPTYDGGVASASSANGDSPSVSAGSSVATRDVVNVVGNSNTVTVGSHHTYLHSVPTTPYETVTRVEYLDRLHSASRSRREIRRLGAGLTMD